MTVWPLRLFSLHNAMALPNCSYFYLAKRFPTSALLFALLSQQISGVSLILRENLGHI